MSNYLHFIFIKDLQQVLWNESVDAFHERLHLLLHAGHEAPLDHLSSNKHSRLLVTSLLSGAHLTCSHKRGTRSLSFPNLTALTTGDKVTVGHFQKIASEPVPSGLCPKLQTHVPSGPLSQ